MKYFEDLPECLIRKEEDGYYFELYGGLDTFTLTKEDISYMNRQFSGVSPYLTIKAGFFCTHQDKDEDGNKRGPLFVIGTKQDDPVLVHLKDVLNIVKEQESIFGTVSHIEGVIELKSDQWLQEKDMLVNETNNHTEGSYMFSLDWSVEWLPSSLSVDEMIQMKESMSGKMESEIVDRSDC